MSYIHITLPCTIIIIIIIIVIYGGIAPRSIQAAARVPGCNGSCFVIINYTRQDDVKTSKRGRRRRTREIDDGGGGDR